MRLKMVSCGVTVGGVLALGAGPVAAQAYVGTWATSPVQCQIDQSRQNAPLVIKPRRYDRHETHCVFTSWRKSGAATWRMRARCTVEGRRQTHTFSLAVEGPALTMRDRYGSQKLIRCT